MARRGQFEIAGIAKIQRIGVRPDGDSSGRLLKVEPGRGRLTGLKTNRNAAMCRHADQRRDAHPGHFAILVLRFRLDCRLERFTVGSPQDQGGGLRFSHRHDRNTLLE